MSYCFFRGNTIFEKRSTDFLKFSVLHLELRVLCSKNGRYSAHNKSGEKLVPWKTKDAKRAQGSGKRKIKEEVLITKNEKPVASRIPDNDIIHNVLLIEMRDFLSKWYPCLTYFRNEI